MGAGAPDDPGGAKPGAEAPRASPGEQDSASIPPSAGGPPESPGQASGRALREAAPILGAASALTGALVLGALGGWWLDGKLGTSPYLLLLGTFSGLVIGLYDVARVVLRPGRGERR